MRDNKRHLKWLINLPQLINLLIVDVRCNPFQVFCICMVSTYTWALFTHALCRTCKCTYTKCQHVFCELQHTINAILRIYNVCKCYSGSLLLYTPTHNFNEKLGYMFAACHMLSSHGEVYEAIYVYLLDST